MRSFSTSPVGITLTLLSLFTCIAWSKVRWGLSHTCVGPNACQADVLYCADALNTSAVCNITCAESACDSAVFIVANSGGLNLTCNNDRECASSHIQWINSDNLALCKALNGSCAVGGPLRHIGCNGDYACHKLQVHGAQQQSALHSVVADWQCAGACSCCHSHASAFRGSVSVNCTQMDACLNFSLKCLEGGNCQAVANKANAAENAKLICERGAESCECGDFWQCVYPYFTTSAVFPTSPKIRTTRATTRQATKSGGNGPSRIRFVLRVIVCVVFFLCTLMSPRLCVGRKPPAPKRKSTDDGEEIKDFTEYGAFLP